MKKIKTLHLKSASELSETQMKHVFAGSGWDSGTDSSFMGNGTGVDPNPKITACKGKKEGEPCDFIDDMGRRQYGRCLAFPLNYILHCSDLN